MNSACSLILRSSRGMIFNLNKTSSIWVLTKLPGMEGGVELRQGSWDSSVEFAEMISPSFDQYSGFIALNTTTNKSMFYWFVESQSKPSSVPVNPSPLGSPR